MLKPLLILAPRSVYHAAHTDSHVTFSERGLVTLALATVHVKRRGYPSEVGAHIAIRTYAARGAGVTAIGLLFAV